MSPRRTGIRRVVGGGSLAELLGARVQVGDAGIYLGGGDRVNDWTVYWVFDNGPAGPPSAGDLRAQLERRQAYLTVLDRHIADVPGQVGNPYWVAGSSRPVERLRVHDRPTPWADLLEALTGTFAEQLDLHAAPWRLTAYTDVRGAPTGPAAADAARDSSVTVLFAQVSHTLLLGEHIESLAGALFGAEPAPFLIPRLGGTVDRPRPVAATIAGAALLPFEYLRWNLRRVGFALRRRAADSADLGFTDRTPSALNAPLGAGLPVARVIRPDIAGARGRGLTVTMLAVTAISLAIERHLIGSGAECPPDLAVLVNVRFDDPRDSPVVNKITAIQADLYPSITDPAERARTIQATARDRLVAMKALAVDALHVGGAIPYRLVVRSHRRSPIDIQEQRLWVAGVTSVRRVGSAADWTLADRPYSFGGHLINSAAAIGLGHSLIGGSTDLTVTVVADADVIGDVDAYTRLLAEAFTEVTAAVAAPTPVGTVVQSK